MQAYSALVTKAVDQKRRRFSGWATRMELDRVNDRIFPRGAKFQNPLVLLAGHDHKLPIGTVVFSAPTDEGIRFEATIPAIEEPGPLKDRLDTHFGEVALGLVRGVSIGFKSIKSAPNKYGGMDYSEVEIYELSTCAVPCLPSAVISQVKALGGRLPIHAGAVKLVHPRGYGSIPLRTTR